MRAKDGALYISWREHAKIIQSELTNRYNFRFLCHLTIVSSYFIAIRGRIMWMCSYSCKDNTWMCFRQCKRESTGIEIATGIYDTCNPRFKGSRNNIFAVCIKAGGVNVGVAINEQTRYPFLGGVPYTSISIVPGFLGCQIRMSAIPEPIHHRLRSEERRVGKECRAR